MLICDVGVAGETGWRDEARAPSGLAEFSVGLVTADLHGAWDFYTTWLGFRTEAEWEHEVRLVHPATRARLVLQQAEVETEHPERVPALTGRGLWLRLVVEDVAAWRQRLAAGGVELVVDAGANRRTERRCVVRGPDGVLVCLEEAGPAGAGV